MNHTVGTPVGADRSIPELLGDLAAELKALVRDELELVRIEMARKGKAAGESAGIFGAATVLALGAFGAFTAMLIALIANVLPLWVASLVVTLLYGAAAAIAAVLGKARLRETGSLVPGRVAENLRDDVGAMKAGVRRGR